MNMYFQTVTNAMKHGNKDSDLVRKIKDGIIHSVI